MFVSVSVLFGFSVFFMHKHLYASNDLIHKLNRHQRMHTSQGLPCHGICEDTEGSYICKCRPGYRSISGDPTKEQCIQKFPLESQLALGIYLWMLIDIFSVCGGKGCCGHEPFSPFPFKMGDY